MNPTIDIANFLNSESKALAHMAGATEEQAKKHTEHTRRISRGQTPSRRWQKLTMAGPTNDAIVWTNDLYMVTARRQETGWVLDNGPWAVLGIWTKDGNARHDWRDYQRIKNDILGPEWEALELYPAESRLIDPSNYYMLYAAPKLPFGKFEPRTILGPENCIAPQRGWSKGDEPPELK